MMEEKRVVLILARRHGLFSLVFQVLGQAYLAEKNGTIPIVYCNRISRYWSEEGYQGYRNVWEYYFEPLSSLKIGDLFSLNNDKLEGASRERFQELSQGRPITATDHYPEVIEWRSPYGINFQRRFVHRLFQKFGRIKPQITAKADEFCRVFSSRSTLGVHYRGKEKIQDGVLVRPTVELRDCFFKEMRRYLERRPGAQIFIATDSAEFLETARKLFGNVVIFQDVDRLAAAEEEVGLHCCERSQARGAVMGEEVLLDALILARTNFFIHGISNVSSAVLFLNPRVRHIDIDVKYGGTAIYMRREYERLKTIFFPAR